MPTLPKIFRPVTRTHTYFLIWPNLVLARKMLIGKQKVIGNLLLPPMTIFVHIYMICKLSKQFLRINISKINMIDIYFISKANTLLFANGIIIPLLTTLDQ